MQFRPVLALAATALLVAACATGGATTAPTVETPAETSPAASAEASPEASAPAGEAACVKSTADGDVQAAIVDFQFDPATIAATVGQTINFTNNDSVPHTASLDDGSCTTRNLGNGESEGLTFNAAGTYPFHCKVHPDMKGTINVS